MFGRAPNSSANPLQSPRHSFGRIHPVSLRQSQGDLLLLGLVTGDGAGAAVPNICRASLSSRSSASPRSVTAPSWIRNTSLREANRNKSQRTFLFQPSINSFCSTHIESSHRVIFLHSIGIPLSTRRISHSKVIMESFKDLVGLSVHLRGFLCQPSHSVRSSKPAKSVGKSAFIPTFFVKAHTFL